MIPQKTGLSRSHSQEYHVSEEREVEEEGQHVFSVRPRAGYLFNLIFKALI